MFSQSIKSKMTPLLTGILAGSIAASLVFGQSNQEQANPAKEQPAQSLRTAPPSSSSSPVFAAHRSLREDAYYKTVWGIDNLVVRETASGSLLRFTYRVLDAKRAQMLGDKKATPILIDEKSGAVLHVPTMQNVGMLRQASDFVDGQEYWTVFSNKGVVKPGSRVDVVIGNFRANGLIVR